MIKIETQGLPPFASNGKDLTDPNTLLDMYSGVFLDEGLGWEAAQRYRSRRDAFREKLTSPCILFGVAEGPDTPYKTWGYCHVPVFQEPLFLFLTGLNQVGLALLIHPSGEDILFLPSIDPHMAFWEGPHFGIGNEEVESLVSTLTGIPTLGPRNKVNAALLDCLEESDDLTGYWHLYRNGKPIKDHNYQAWKRCDQALRRYDESPEWENISGEQWALRLPLDAIDIDHMKTANEITRLAFLETLAVLPTCKTETEVAGILNAGIQMRSWFGNSFPSIVAAGANATILHYHKNNSPISKDSLVLLDFGARWQSMHADVSRTIPCSGKFNPLQKKLYTILLNAQQQVEKATKPGVTIAELNTLCWAHINQDLATLKAEGAVIDLDYKDLPHNVSHLLGRQVHDGDPQRNYRDMPLTPGLMITNEPGLYGRFQMTLDGIVYDEAIGIRIEDDLLITETGVENLSASIPKSIEDLEALLS
jgi:Xaa-Pro aminopeptidase